MADVMIVTGAARGIGAAIAHAAAKAGWRVCVNYATSAKDAAAAVEAIRQAGGAAESAQADVSRAEGVERLFAAADRMGRLGALINNAGIVGPETAIVDMTAEGLAQVFAANVISQFLCAGAAVKRMSTARGGQGGAIVNISSVAARLGGRTGQVGYAASKGAVDTFTIGLSREVAGEGIRVNAIRPGMTETKMLQRTPRAALDAIAATIPLRRTGAPEEIAEAAVWLCSPASSYVHGAILDVSGGR